jgi:hypothetical protein
MAATTVGGVKTRPAVPPTTTLKTLGCASGVGSTDCQSHYGVAIQKNDLLGEASVQLAYAMVFTELPAVTVAVTVDTTGAGGEGPGKTGRR